MTSSRVSPDVEEPAFELDNLVCCNKQRRAGREIMFKIRVAKKKKESSPHKHTAKWGPGSPRFFYWHFFMNKPQLVTHIYIHTIGIMQTVSYFIYNTDNTH